MKSPSFLIAFFSTIVRYYDYALFGLSASVLAQNFMPPSSDEHQILYFFAVFSTALIARPVGSIIFGKVGDNYGRSKSVKIASLLAAISTSLIAIIPSFNRIGIMATLLLTISRIVFLLSLSGEIDSIKIYVAEKANLSNKNLACGLVSFSSQIGALLAALAYHYAILFHNYGALWRINFIIGGFGSLLVVLMRSNFVDSPEFLEYKIKNKENNISNLNFFQIIKDEKIKFIIALLINGCSGGIYHILVIFLGTFLSKVIFVISPDQAQIMNIMLIAIYAVMSVLSGFIADRVNPRKQIILSLILSFLVGSMIVLLIFRGIYSVYLICILMALVPLYVVPLQIIVQSIFSIGVKMRMYSLSHSLGGLIFSGTSPFFCMILWKYTGSLIIVLSFPMILLSLIFLSVLYLGYSKIIDE